MWRATTKRASTSAVGSNLVNWVGTRSTQALPASSHNLGLFTIVPARTFSASPLARDSIKVLVSAESVGARTQVKDEPERKHTFVFDEPTKVGGTDTGPSPLQGVLGALAGCENATARMRPILLLPPHYLSFSIMCLYFYFSLSRCGGQKATIERRKDGLSYRRPVG